MSETRWNDDAAFEAYIAPNRELLTRLVEASRELKDQWSELPAEDSPAMAELAAEHQFRGDPPWDNEPATAAHNIAHLVIFGAEDHATALVRLLEDDHTPVFAHIVLARACLEYAAKGWWLLDAGIGLRLRIARGMNERLLTLSEAARLPLPDEERERAKKRRAEIFDRGTSLGFQKVRPLRATWRPGASRWFRSSSLR